MIKPIVKTIMKIIILITLINLITGCTFQQPWKQNVLPKEVADKARKDCIYQKLPDIDDGISDGMTVAMALAKSCSKQDQDLINAVAADLDNSQQVIMFKEESSNSLRQAERFLPWVMRYRKYKSEQH